MGSDKNQVPLNVVELSTRLAPWLLVGLIALMLYVPWGGMRDLWFPDEPDVADPTMTMVATGNWVVPTMNAKPWLDYPPFTYWMGAASASVFGSAAPFVLRLPVALLAVLGCVLTTWAGSRNFGRRAGLWAGLSMLTAPHFIFQATNFHVDMAFAMAQAGGLGLYAWGFLGQRGWRDAALRTAGFACFGIAMLSKGPLGLLLPGFILTVWHLSRKEWLEVILLGPLTLAALAVALPWYMALSDAIGGGYVWEQIYEQNFRRFSSGNRGHQQPFHYYSTRIWADWGVWSIFLPLALWQAWQRRSEPLMRLLFIWFTACFLFLSAAVTKRQVYLLPLYPAIALMIGSYLDRLLDSDAARGYRWPLRVISILFMLIGICLPVALAVFIGSGFEDPKLQRVATVIVDLWLPILLLAACFVVAAWQGWQRGRDGLGEGVLVTWAALLVVVFTVLFASIFWRIDQERSYRSATEEIRQLAGKTAFGYYTPYFGQKVSGFRVNDPAFMALVPLSNPQAVKRYLATSPHLVILRIRALNQLTDALKNWDALPKREFQLSTKRYIVLGPLAKAPTTP